jgi:phage gp46-like protein
MDFRLVPISSPFITLDLATDVAGQPEETADLVTAIYIALMSDALADESDDLPFLNTSDRRGWWADADAEEIWGAWPIGSLLWLLKRSSLTDPGYKGGSTLARVQQYISKALQPFVDNKICSKFDIASRQTKDGISSVLTIYRGPKVAIALQFQALWDDLQTNSGVR